MKFSSDFLLSFLFIFARCSALFLSSPLMGKNVPVRIRIGIILILSLSLVTVISPSLSNLPITLYGIMVRGLYEIFVGIIIGAFLHFLILAAQMAGAYLDLQIGLGSTQLLNPVSSTPVSLIAQFKYILAIVLFFILNGHHQVIEAIVKSYQFKPEFHTDMLLAIKAQLPPFITHLMLLAIQIAIPVIGVGIVVDAASGIVNKAVPQMQIYMVAMPAKIIVGLFMLTLSLPILCSALQSGLEHTWKIIFNILNKGGS